MVAIGIDDIELVATHDVLELAELARVRGVDPAKYEIGLGQTRMSVPAADEDPITMGATAAARLLERTGTDGIRSLLFATETGVDQSKSGGMFIHGLLGLPKAMRVAEIKQACYAGTVALQSALGVIAREPESKVLIVMSDIAKYELEGSGEPTQGAGAVAMLVSANPALVEIEPETGIYSADVDDFWRPNDSTTAVVDGALSLSAYLDTLTGSWDDYQARGGHSVAEIDRFLYHQPFTKMARKGHRELAKHTGTELPEDVLEASFVYNRELGNTYGASIYSALISLMHHDEELAGKRIGFYSYGSGSTGEYFTGVVRDDYRDHIHTEPIQSELAARNVITFDEYVELHERVLPSGVDVENPRVTNAPYRFAGIRGGARQYEANS
ncbi:hydroxymethylglutaryl-CoA synthase [Gulosibacter molinativorax]|uniref:Hydroxymethylglutaryl-CoA synthase n=1 Tax=Gulosibacter molinativorax TaxID=256821 RepID=A0ABT7C8X2_9MICO|nr:hydroxymethylglutaryl-CoA synthase [Gulosibacter molinativorax]MDJ1371664.1 hydroxymethylglutaryl-CoA synthase [Gulosibacter molinativorax]QUY63086.1 Polyketide biosynthesis 3-hydroxy-3-methylglutaryl-ACP synthase PksG [Gulosibacter molinativorax]